MMASFVLNSAVAVGHCVQKSATLLLQKNVPVIFLASRFESSLPPLTTKQLSENIQLRTVQETAHYPRPLVLLFGWMLAKQRHLDKYCNMYHSNGFDVLSLKMKPAQVLIPQRAQNTVEQLLSVLQEPGLTKRPLMVHGFSVGGYMYGELLLKLDQQREKYQCIRDQLTCQVFDSPVDFEGVAPGFASVLVDNKLAQKVIRKSLEVYLNTFKTTITSHYLRSSAAFHKNELRLPSLLLYSRSDPIGVDTKIEQVMKKWKAAGVPVMARCWESSPHVSHFHRHPDEYVEAVLKFLDSVGLTKQEAAKKVLRSKVQKSQEAQQAL
ncbi:unnamed protein product [Candidula unifasciata]|uniref:Uncharacterized protein n=1 Tax=Candidula unifasciata TaxID=100452 RepID=A0A8S3YGD8_9EUPU|nr:unnamed protein product [Candidula unifasciata]